MSKSFLSYSASSYGLPSQKMQQNLSLFSCIDPNSISGHLLWLVLYQGCFISSITLITETPLLLSFLKYRILSLRTHSQFITKAMKWNLHLLSYNANLSVECRISRLSSFINLFPI